MVDAAQVLLDYLQSQATLTALTSTRIWAETNEPPPGYEPADGAGICFKTRGGPGFDEEDAILTPSFQFKVYGLTRTLSRACYRELCNVLHSNRGARILMGNLEAPGEILQEPDTDWYFTLCFFTVNFINS